MSLSKEEKAELALSEELLMERAEAGWRLLKDKKTNVDPLDVLVAIVWPSAEAVEAQLAQRAA